jgi:DNA-directed RNA polymerase specialized sigma24 family protein
VTSRCGNPWDISDILQEIYGEFYRVLLKKGIAYIREPEAFVMQLTKSKVFRHYSLSEKWKNTFPMKVKEQFTVPMEPEADPNQYELIEMDDLVANRILLRQISDFIKTKPADIQKIFYLHYGLEKTSAQIAVALHLNETTVKSKIHRTVHQVRALYGKVGKEQ